ncbi:MAG: hypothetical protein NTV46_05365 [Verrucomicrobia bacterium]|nr:hypothetical protein [Verrucomicrobiota bacterium]
MPDTPSNNHAASRLVLSACLQSLRQGPWQFIQLRGATLDEHAIDGDDLDLLGSREAVASLLEAALGWVRAGHCHLRVKSTNRCKVGLFLISTDARHRLDLDLWIDLRQIDKRKRALTYQDCQAAVLNPQESIQRLPVTLEACIFIHHLVAKQKNIATPKQLARLSAYAAQCRTAGQEALALALEATATTAHVSDATADLTLKLLEQHLRISRPSPVTRLARRLRDAVITAWFVPRPTHRMLVLMGCDGCGKTSLARQLISCREDVLSVYTGKHLYRKWFVYKLLVIFVRPLLCQGREKFDETFAPLAYLLACLRLRLKLLWRRQGIVLIDRSIMDFLLLARKSDAPRFSTWRWLAGLFGTRLPHVHFIVPFVRLRERKLEMTQAGHEIYDTAMFHYFSRRVPTDYVAFDNHGLLDDSAAALSRIVDWLNPSCCANGRRPISKEHPN